MTAGKELTNLDSLHFMRTSGNELRDLLKERSLLRGSIQLSTGQESAFYFDCKRVTLSCRGAKLIGDAFFSVIKSLPEKTYAIGGSGLGGASIVTAIQLCALERGVSYEGFYVRAEPKKHGTRKWLENEPPTGSKVAVVDDVVTSGRSVLHTVEKATEHGCEVVAVITLVDRCQGGADAIRKHVPEYRAIFTRADFSDALQLEQSNASA